MTTTHQDLAAQPGLTLAALQRAHVSRQEQWCPEQKPDLSFRGNELGGECGEAQNVIKKLERERQGWRGSRDTVEHLGEELADVVHCAVLCAITAGIDLERAVVDKFNSTSDKNGLACRLEAASVPPGAVERNIANFVQCQECERLDPDATCPQCPGWIKALDEKQIEDCFQEAAGADEEVHIRFAHAVIAKFCELNRLPPRAALSAPSPAPALVPQGAELREAVLSAALEWTSERMPNDWAEVDLMKAVISLDGDWPGCDECDHECGEPCEPATVAEMHYRIDLHIADLVHAKKLYPPEGYAPPKGWKPTIRIERAHGSGTKGADQ